MNASSRDVDRANFSPRKADLKIGAEDPPSRDLAHVISTRGRPITLRCCKNSEL
jgi:hypothetical protein